MGIGCGSRAAPGPASRTPRPDGPMAVLSEQRRSWPIPAGFPGAPEVTLPTDRQIQETIARCVSTMVYFHNAERTPRSEDLMAAEVQVVAGWVEEMALGPREADELLLRPVEAELVQRYGPELGPRLGRIFREAFDRRDAEAPPPAPAPATRGRLVDGRPCSVGSGVAGARGLCPGHPKTSRTTVSNRLE